MDNWNAAISLATRSYIKLLGADDRIAKGGVSKLKHMINASPKAIFHGHLAIIIDENGHEIRRQRAYSSSANPLCLGGVDALKLKLRQVARFKEPPCNLFSKSAWQEVGGYSKKFRFCPDIEFNVKMMRYGECCLWNEYAVELRRHAKSDGRQLPADLALTDLRQLIEDIYLLIGDRLTRNDRRYGDAWLMYRLVELGVARYQRQPLELLSFLYRHRSNIVIDPTTLSILMRMFTRQALRKDVQAGWLTESGATRAQMRMAQPVRTCTRNIVVIAEV